MAAQSKKSKLNYSEEVRALRSGGPERLYLLYGEEDYLREQFLSEIKKLCLGGADDFNYRRTDSPALALSARERDVVAMPLMGERTLIELRGVDINRIRDAALERLTAIVSDIPDYCTVVFVMDSGYSPDGRLGSVKMLKKHGKALEFSVQEQSQLTAWVTRRYSALGKHISRADAEHMIFVSGSLMTRLIPEIEKVASDAAGNTVTAADIDAAAQRIPEANVFEMTEMAANGNYDGAARVLSELLDAREAPIMLLALIGQQFRRLYAAALCIECGAGADKMKELTEVKYDFILTKLRAAARRRTAAQLAFAVSLCAEYDYRMKSSGEDEEELIKELLARLAAGV